MGNWWDLQNDWNTLTHDWDTFVNDAEERLIDIGIYINRYHLDQLLRILGTDAIELIPRMIEKITQAGADIGTILDQFIEGSHWYGLDGFARRLHQGIIVERTDAYTRHQSIQASRIAQIHQDTIAGIHERLQRLYEGDITPSQGSPLFSGALAQSISIRYQEVARDTLTMAMPFSPDGQIVLANTHLFNQVTPDPVWSILTAVVIGIVDLLLIAFFASIDVAAAIASFGVAIPAEPATVALEIGIIAATDYFLWQASLSLYAATHSEAVQSSQPSSSSSSPGNAPPAQLTAKDIQDITQDIVTQVNRSYPGTEITEGDIESLVQQIAGLDPTLSKEAIKTIVMQLIAVLGGGYYLAGLTMQQIIKIFIYFAQDNQSGRVRWDEAFVVIGLIMEGTIVPQFDENGDLTNMGRPSTGDFTYNGQTYDIKQCFDRLLNRPLTPSDIEGNVLKDFGNDEDVVLDISDLERYDPGDVERIESLARQLVEGHPGRSIWIWQGPGIPPIILP